MLWTARRKRSSPQQRSDTDTLTRCRGCRRSSAANAVVATTEASHRLADTAPWLQVLERGERIEVIVDKTEDLQNQADQFRRQGRDLRNKMWWQNMKIKLLVAAAVVLLIIVLFSTICFAGGNNCTK